MGTRLTVAAQDSPDSFLTRHNSIQAMPDTALRLMRLFRDPSCSAGALQKVIEQDAALSAKVIKSVNSAFYGLPHKISNLQRAIAYMGIKAVKEVTLASSLTESTKPVPLGQYSTADLWDHSLAVAVFSRELAVRTRAVDPEDAFLAGILHDIGLLFEAQSEPQKCTELFSQSDANGSDFSEREDAVFGFDHCQLGVKISEKWKFPEDLASSIRWHHCPDEADAAHQAMCLHVWLADRQCCALGTGFSQTCGQAAVEDDALARVDISRESFEALSAKLPVLLRLHRH
jgi:putative nucleotidyltransferase with HDIG domain